MTGAPVPVEAEWALHASSPGPERFRLLACSTGDLRARNFEDAIDRFGPDAREDQAEVTISYLRPAVEPTAGYLALAIRRAAGSAGTARAVGYTSYFCLPYWPLAMEAVTYQAMYEALDPVRLPGSDGPPLRVELPARPSATPAVDGRAMQAAALLLTGRPVCVFGAGEVPLAGRLAFIDTVMALLPYGLRARLAAATWVAPGGQEHKFRLFFSDTPRPADRLLNWEDAGQRVVSPHDDWAHEYLAWLTDKVSQPGAKLAEMISPARFSRKEILPALDEIGIIGPQPGQNYSKTKQDLLPESAPRTEKDREQLLLDCAGHVRDGDHGKVKSDLRQLTSIAAGPVDDAQRARYQKIIKEGRLLEPHASLGRYGSRLHQQLLKVAFPVPFSYRAYCQLEECLAEAVREDVLPPLLPLIADCGMADQVTAALVCWELWKADKRKKKESAGQRLASWGADHELDAAGLVRALGSGQVRPAHAVTVGDVMLDLLLMINKDADHAAIRAALFQHQYLAHADTIRARPPQAEVQALRALLRAAYPDMLSRPDIVEVLGDTRPTPALLAAVLLYLRYPADMRLAWRAFAHGAVSGMALAPAYRSRMLRDLPPVDARAWP